jgi:hypothetical protein
MRGVDFDRGSNKRHSTTLQHKALKDARVKPKNKQTNENVILTRAIVDHGQNREISVIKLTPHMVRRSPLPHLFQAKFTVAAVDWY